MAGPPDEPPTRRLDPVTPPPSTPREMEVVTEAPGEARAAILDELRSIKRALALIGVIAIVALGVGLWALLDQSSNDDSGRSAASSSQVDDLESRVNTLENRIDDRATKDSVSSVKSDVSDLEDKVDALDKQSSSTDSQDAVDQVQQDVDDLTKQVDDLSQQVQDQQDSGGGTTTTP